MRKQFSSLLVFLIFIISIVQSQNTTQTFTTSGNFTVPSGVTTITVECWGGGGAGGGSTSDNNGGGGGGGGAYASKTISVTPGDVIPFTVGAGGTTGTGNGSNGGTTTFQTNVVVAAGGNGGGSNSGGAGGTGGLGTSCIGDVIFSGGNGAAGSEGTSGGGGGGAGSTEIGASAAGITGGLGGVVGGGNGANGRTDAGNGSAGSSYGGGGSGGRKGGLLTSSRSGGAGSVGAVKISFDLPNCSGNPNPAGVISSNSASGCAGSSITLTANGVSTDFGIEYKWLKSTDGGSTWSDISAFAAVPPTGTFSINQTIQVTTLFKLETRCTLDANLTSYSNEISFQVNCWTLPTNTTVTTCGGTFFDSGSASGDYAVSQSYTYTFYPANPSEKIRLVFSQFVTESGWDGMVIYNGNSTAAPIISSGLAAGSSTTNCPAGSWYGSSSPGTITSSAVDGSLTFTFKSDGSTNAAGWTANLSCVNVPATPNTPISNSPNCDSVTITRNGVPPTDETWYWQTVANGTNTTNSNETYTVTTSGTYYLRSLKTSNNEWSLPTSINVVVHVIPTCANTPLPLNNDTTVCYAGYSKLTSLSWAAVSGATSYDVFIGENAIPSTPTANVTTNSYTLPSDLLPSTNYKWKIIPKNACGEASGCSEWNFTTIASICSCNPSTLDCSYENITKVVFAGINNSSACSTNGYGNYTDINPAQVVKGESYPLSVTVTCDGTEYVGAWFDFNKNGIFESTEYFSVGNTSTSNTTLTQNILIPLTAESGMVRMRIRQNYNAAIVNTESCTTTSTYGEVEDYYVNICEVPAKPETPLSNSPQCGVVQIFVTGVPPVNENWYWQNLVDGTDLTNSTNSYNVTVSGRYYIRSLNSCGLWSDSDSIDVIVYQNSVLASSIDGNLYAMNNESVDLTVVGGTLGYEAQWRWYDENCGTSLPLGEGLTITVSPSNSINNYYVRAEGLCDTTDCVQHTIELYQPAAGVCDVIYVSTSGNDNYAGTIDYPVKSLYRAVQLVNSDRNHIKLEATTFNETKRTNLPDNVFIEGGFKIMNGIWVKTNAIRTQIHYLESTNGNNPTVTNIDDYIRNLIGISSDTANGWTLQDINVTTANASLQSVYGNGMNNYALWINSSSNYTIIGCNIVAGSASNGLNGEAVTGYAALGGIGGNGGAAGNNFGLNGTDGETVMNGATGGSGNIGGSGCTGGCRAGNGLNGLNGVDGITWVAGDKPISVLENTIYFVPIPSTDGQAGGGGGGAGGGGGSDSYNLGLCGAMPGGKGGNGGRGGNAGLGGKAGGSSFGIWMYESNTNGYIINSNVSAGTAGIGGSGSEGVTGENGLAGVAGGSSGGLCSSSNGGGTGGNGGKGGNGGRGRDGADGISAGIVANGFVSSSLYDFVQTPEINIYQPANKTCRNSQITLVKETGSGDWDFGGDLLFINDVNIMTSSFTNSSDSIEVYSPYINYTYNLTLPVEFNRFMVTSADERTLPNLTITPTTICQNSGNISFSATSWGNEEDFEWIIFQNTTDNVILNSNSQVPNFNMASLQDGTYQVRYRVKESCCGWSIPVYGQFVINPAPDEVMVTGGGTVCSATTTLTADGGAGGTIYWQNTTSNGTSTANGNTIQNITENGTYYFRAVSSLGCWNEQTEVNVILNTPPTPVSVIGGTTQCGGTVVLTANGGNGGTIYFQGTTPNGTAVDMATNTYSATTSGVYYFRSQSSDGCWGQEGSAQVVINSVPTDVMVTGGGTYCGSPVILNATGGTGGLIYCQNTTSNGVSTTNQTYSYNVSASGTYYFRAKSPEGCWSNEGNAVVVINNPPSNLQVSNLTHHSAQLSWTENGSANLWNIEWGVAGFTLGSGNTILNVTQNPYTLNGLASNTSYDFYVRSVCSVSDVGAWSSVKNFTTLVNAISENSDEDAQIWLYDNILFVELPNNETLKEIDVYDMQGRLILTSNTKITSLDAFETGIYVVRVSSDEQIRVEKIKIVK